MALLAHNAWLENILADTSDDSYPTKVIRNKPASLQDACWDAAGVKSEEPATLDPNAVCNQLFPIHGNVRVAAGGPLAGDILKCRRQGIDYRDHAVTFTPEERARLKRIFPTGVCDWSKPSEHQLRFKGTWLDFTNPYLRSRGGARVIRCLRKPAAMPLTVSTMTSRRRSASGPSGSPRAPEATNCSRHSSPISGRRDGARGPGPKGRRSPIPGAPYPRPPHRSSFLLPAHGGAPAGTTRTRAGRAPPVHEDPAPPGTRRP